MTQKERERQVGILEMVCALAALATVVSSLVWEVSVNLFIALIMLIAAYAVLRDLRVLWLSKRTMNEDSNTSEANAPVHRQTPGETRPRTT